MPSVGGLTVVIEAAPDTLAAATTGAAAPTGAVTAKLSNVSMLPLDAEFLTIDSSDDQVATAQRTKGRAKHVISVGARPSALSAAVSQMRQETIASWESKQAGTAVLTAQFQVTTRFGRILGNVAPDVGVTVT